MQALEGREGPSPTLHLSRALSLPGVAGMSPLGRDRESSLLCAPSQGAWRSCGAGIRTPRPRGRKRGQRGKKGLTEEPGRRQHPDSPLNSDCPRREGKRAQPPSAPLWPGRDQARGPALDTWTRVAHCHNGTRPEQGLRAFLSRAEDRLPGLAGHTGSVPTPRFRCQTRQPRGVAGCQ